MFAVVLLTEVAVNRRLVVERGVNVTVVAPPALSRLGTVTVVPFENVSVPAVTRSPVFGRS